MGSHAADSPPVGSSSVAGDAGVLAAFAPCCLRCLTPCHLLHMDCVM